MAAAGTLALIGAGPAGAWGSVNCSATYVWNSFGYGDISPELTKPSGNGDKCVDVNIQVTGSAEFQVYDASTNHFYSPTPCYPGDPIGTRINALTPLINGGNLFEVIDDTSDGEDTRIVY